MNFKLTLLLLFSFGAFSQNTFEKLLGTNAVGTHCLVTSAGDYVIAGKNNGPIHSFYVVKLSIQGDTLWTKTYEPVYMNNEVISSIIEVPGGDLIFSGHVGNSPSPLSHSAVFRLDASGNVVWQKRIQGGINSMRFTANGELLLSGFALSALADYGMLCQLDTQGNMVWGGFQKSFANIYENTSAPPNMQDAIKLPDGT